MTTEEDWRAPGTPTPPSPVLSEAITRVTSGLDALLAVAPASLSDEDVARLLTSRPAVSTARRVR